jgi:hypothetical protein
MNQKNDTNILADIFYIPLPKVKYQSELQKNQGRRYINRNDIEWLTKPKLEAFLVTQKKIAKKNKDKLGMYTTKHPKFAKLEESYDEAQSIVNEIKANLQGRKDEAKAKREMDKLLTQYPFLSFWPAAISDNLNDDYPWQNIDSQYANYEIGHQFYIRDDRYLPPKWSDYGLDWEEKGFGFYEECEADDVESCIKLAKNLISQGKEYENE